MATLLPKKNIDFTTGSIIKKLAIFAIPFILGELFQNLYNSVDALIVGNYLGQEPLAAINISTPITSTVIGFFNGMSIGSSVIVSHAFGGGERDTLSRTLRVAFSFAVLIGLVFSVVGPLLGAPGFLWASGVEGAVYDLSLLYLRIYMVGLVCTVIYNIGSGMMRAIGDSRTPFNILLITSGINVVTDILFVAVFKWGVAGAAFATVLAQFVSVVLIYRQFRRVDDAFRISFRELPQEREIVGRILKIGVPAGVQGALVPLSSLFMWRYINPFGSAAQAGVGVAQRLDKFVDMPLKALGSSLTTLVGQNLGARDPKRAREGIRSCAKLEFLSLAVMSVLMYVGAPFFVSLFNKEQAVIDIGAGMMRTIIPLYAFLAVREMVLGALRGYGNTTAPMVFSLLGMIGVRQTFLAIANAVHPALSNVYYGYPMAWGSTALFLTIYYLTVRRRYSPEYLAEHPEEYEKLRIQKK